MNGKVNGADPIQAAVDAVEEPASRTAVSVTIASSQRVVTIDFPNDVTESDLLEFSGWIGTVLMNSVRARPANRLVVASRLPSN